MAELTDLMGREIQEGLYVYIGLQQYSEFLGPSQRFTRFYKVSRNKDMWVYASILIDKPHTEVYDLFAPIARNCRLASRQDLAEDISHLESFEQAEDPIWEHAQRLRAILSSFS
jgi:hypothetical protein